MVPDQTGRTRVQGNRIGLGAAGGAVGNNGPGVLIRDTSNSTVRGTLSTAMNVIAGNNGPSVRITGHRAAGNDILGNRIGTSADGTAAVANAGDGVLVNNDARFNKIGTRNALPFDHDLDLAVDGLREHHRLHLRRLSPMLGLRGAVTVTRNLRRQFCRHFKRLIGATPGQFRMPARIA